MKEELYTSLICKKFCYYYKPGKENETCNGYSYLKQSITPSELNDLIEIFHLQMEEIANKNVSFICNECDFRIDGCDFFVDKSSYPCGGYLLISRLFRHFNY